MTVPYRSGDPQTGSYKAPSVDSVPNNAVPSMPLQRTLPRQLSTGSTRGTQTVGYGNTKIDGSNNSISVGDTVLLDGNSGSITVTNSDGSQVGMGLIPGSTGEYGFFNVDSHGNLALKIVLGTMYAYDPNTQKNSFQAGILPDGTGGAAGANTGYNVADGF